MAERSNKWKQGDRIVCSMATGFGGGQEYYKGKIIDFVQTRGDYPGALIEFDEPSSLHRGAIEGKHRDSDRHDVLPLAWLERAR